VRGASPGAPAAGGAPAALRRAGHRTRQRRGSKPSLAFAWFDRGARGRIAFRDVRDALRASGFDVSAAHARLLLREHNVRVDDDVTFRVFEAVCETIRAAERTAHLRQLRRHGGRDALAPVPLPRPRTVGADRWRIFQWFDRDGSGTIDAEELLRALRRLGFRTSVGMVDRLLRHVDADESGDVSFEEFGSVLELLEEVRRQKHLAALRSAVESRTKRVAAPGERASSAPRARGVANPAAGGGRRDAREARRHRGGGARSVPKRKGGGAGRQKRPARAAGGRQRRGTIERKFSPGTTAAIAHAVFADEGLSEPERIRRERQGRREHQLRAP
jgi:Ca2+-binding EF-hand superfamily protein